jgi:hypothetical protein
MSGAGRRAYRGSTWGLSAILAVVGVVLIVRTALLGASGAAIGYIVGVGLVAAAILRVVVLRRTS